MRLSNVTIITPVRNAVQTITTCLDSIAGQTYKHIEHVIVDGASTDGTLDIILNRCQMTDATVLSEPDTGIYDAMNKGIALATGDVIGILNSDDYYADSSIVTKVAEIFSRQDVDSCYGNLMYVDHTDTSKIFRNWKSGAFNDRSFYWGWMPPHPTFFVRRSVYEKFGMFNLDLGSAADYELMLRFLVKYKITTAYISEVLVKMRTAGTSNASLKNRIKANRMDRKAWDVNGLKPYPWTTYLKPLRKIGQFFV